MTLPHVSHAEPMTVGALKKYIRNLPDDTKVYMLTDKSPTNWDDELGRWATVHPLGFCSREALSEGGGFDDMDEDEELNLLLEIEE